MNQTMKLLGVISLISAIGGAAAQTFPSKPIRVINGFPGGATDVSSRLVAQELTKRLGQQVIVESVVGAGGSIAARQASNAAPDGHTLFYGAASGIAPIFQKNGLYLAKSFLPVSRTMWQPYVWFTSGKYPFNTLQDLVAYSKANPGKLNFGASGASLPMVAQYVKTRTGLGEYVHISYKSSGDVLQAMISGDVHFTTNLLTGTAPHIRSGTVRAVFVMSPQRSSLSPGIPSATEIGYPDLVVSANYGFWVPLGTPAEIVQRLSREAAAAVKTPEVSERLRSEAVAGEPDGSTPEEQMRVYDQEIRFWSELAKSMNYEPQ